ncbi:MAG: type II toxin-antitoxin system Phd/YefM family antitoxin [Chloroflexi bacterium]|nr:type II toxin-antitoxin system Phd/YefM family antitoxin [Chloroflexota bacterium]
MSTITIPVQISEDEIKRNLSAYLRRVQAGQTVVIMTAGTPLIEMRPFDSSSQFKRPIGLGAGEFTVPDDFDAPLPENIMQEFEA